MNKGKKQQAKELYYQTDLTKTEIADTLGISRRALHYWIKVHNWDKLKESAAVLPSLLAQKCYHIIGHLTDNYLDEMRAHKPVTITEAETLYKLTLTIRKLKQHSTMCEIMEVFKDFNERLSKHDKKLSKSLSGYMEQYFISEASDTPQAFQSKDYNSQGRLIHQTGEIDIDEDFGPTEKKLDERDLLDWAIETHTKGYVAQPPVHPAPPPPPAGTPAEAPPAAQNEAPASKRKTGEKCANSAQN